MNVEGVEITTVFELLLADGTWHKIEQGSLQIGEPEGDWYNDMVPVAIEDGPMPMFSCLLDGDGPHVKMKGQLSSILAVKERAYD
jgi:hypothetical protein